MSSSMLTVGKHRLETIKELVDTVHDFGRLLESGLWEIKAYWEDASPSIKHETPNNFKP